MKYTHELYWFIHACKGSREQWERVLSVVAFTVLRYWPKTTKRIKTLNNLHFAKEKQETISKSCNRLSSSWRGRWSWSCSRLYDLLWTSIVATTWANKLCKPLARMRTSLLLCFANEYLYPAGSVHIAVVLKFPLFFSFSLDAHIVLAYRSPYKYLKHQEFLTWTLTLISAYKHD